VFKLLAYTLNSQVNEIYYQSDQINLLTIEKIKYYILTGNFMKYAKKQKTKKPIGQSWEQL